VEKQLNRFFLPLSEPFASTATATLTDTRSFIEAQFPV
jgi:hypothetical protein